MDKNKKNTKKTNIFANVDKKKIIVLFAVVVMAVLLVFGVFQTVKRFLTVKHLEVTGISIYDSTEIISASGVRRGNLLYMLEEEDIEEKILKECPYLESVKLIKEFPNTLRFDVEGRSAQWYVEVADTKYALDGDLVVIAETAKTQGMTKLILPNVKNVIVGNVPEFGESETEIKKTVEIISAVRSTTFKTRITELDVKSRWDIHITVDESFYITMGDTSDFEAKLKAVESVLNDDSLKDCVGGEMNVLDPANPAFKPIYSKSKAE